MSVAVAVRESDTVPPTRAGVPLVPHWTVPRPRLDRLLDRGAEGVLTVVSAPAGSGKTLGVASWVAGPSSPSGVVWVNLARGGAEPDRLWRLVRRALQQAGEQHLPLLPTTAAAGPDRMRALVELGEALRDRCPWVVVLDGYPTGSPTQLGSELETVLEHAGGSLRVVLLCQGDPALDLHRFEAAGQLVRATAADLLMDHAEIAGVLRLGNNAYDRATVAAVASRTFGWACGVRRAAVARETAADWASALEETERAIQDYLTQEVLGGLTAPVRRFLVWTSVVEVVDAGLVLAGLGTESDAEIDRTSAGTGLVQRFRDGSIACHPLLRAAARARLGQESPEASPEAHERVVRWFADHDAPEAAVDLCLAARDWTQAASVLVQSHAVPRLVAGTADAAVVRAAGLSEVQAAEPLLHAAVAMARGDAMAADVALAGATTPEPAAGNPARLLAAAFVQLGIGRLSGRSEDAVGLVPRTRGLLAQSSVAALDDLTDLTADLDAFAGAEELSNGDPDRAAVTLARGAARGSLDCAGQLAVLEALRGDLGQASGRALGVLRAGADHARFGVAHAQLALAWVAVDRLDLAAATARLDDVDARPGIVEPWLLLARRLVRARLLIASGKPDEALRLAVFGSPETLGQCCVWFAGLAASVSAEALLAVGEPQQALGVVTRGLPAGSPERAVLTAIACRDIGDVRGAAAAMASTANDLHRASRASQVQGWVLEARLALDRGEGDRAATLVERALRSASVEELRRPLAADGPWLRWFLDREGSAQRTLRPFVQSVVGPGAAPLTGRVPKASADAVLEPLTERETQVLELLAQMCSTDEIAAELFVSANTVKTHLKGIFRKYSVNRRVDAVRRGRELGLC